MKSRNKIKLMLIDPTNVAEVYNRNFSRFMYLNSDKVIVNGEELSDQTERQAMMLPNKQGEPNIKTVEICQTKDGFPLTEQDFIEYELETLRDERGLRFKEKKQLELYKKFLLDRRQEIESPSGQNNTTGLSIQEIALKLFYEGEFVTRDNSDAIAKSYGKNSGESLYQWYVRWSSKANRIAEPHPSTPKKLTNKIERLKKVISTLAPAHKSLAEVELEILQNTFEEKYG